MLAETRNIIKWQSPGNTIGEVTTNYDSDWIANESILTIFVNNEELTSFSCSPLNLDEMAIGFLFSSGIISNLNETEILKYCNTSNTVSITLKKSIPFDINDWKKNQTLTSGCGHGISLNMKLARTNISRITNSLQVGSKYICKLFSDLRHISQGYEKTGCIHTAALIKRQGPSLIREDIGRHNAIDKVLGAGIKSKINFSDYLLCCSGRISSDMLLKGGRAGIPIIISRAAPTSLAVDIAMELGITLIGFVRGLRFNIYSHPDRISLTDNLNEINIDELSEINATT